MRNYDLSPDLNESLLLCTEWTGRAVMGMVEFLWGLILAGQRWDHALHAFVEGRRDADEVSGQAALRPPRYDAGSSLDWSRAGQIDWASVAADYANGRGRAIHIYLPAKAQQ